MTRVPGLLAVAAPLLLAGLLPLSPDLSSRWGWSGTWLAPVGDPYLIPDAALNGDTEYRILRGVSPPTDQDRGHQGADLSNGGGGGVVRAAGNGLVVQVGAAGWNHGYGRHVVIAHQLPGGDLVYSVYAHLAPGSVTVHKGELVSAGREIGRVGMTGRATSPHLHFEVRRPADPFARWENAEVLDPMDFLAGHLAMEPADSTWSRPYLQWAEHAALIPPGEEGDQRPSRADWWRVLLLSTRHPMERVPAAPESLRTLLVSMKLLQEDRRANADAPLTWNDLARGASRAKERGLRLPYSPTARAERRQRCLAELGTEAPADRAAGIGKDRDGGPTCAAMCLLMADLAGDPPKKPKANPKSKPKKPPATAPAPAPAS
jgi:hypothetical protein